MIENPMFSDYGWGYNNDDENGIVCSCDYCGNYVYANELVYYDRGANQVYCRDCYEEIVNDLEVEERELFLDDIHELYGWELVD